MLSILGMLLLSVPFVLAQVLVKGTVKDNLGEGVPGASVQVKGTSQGTITDLDGKFTLNIPQKARGEALKRIKSFSPHNKDI